MLFYPCFHKNATKKQKEEGNGTGCGITVEHRLRRTPVRSVTLNSYIFMTLSKPHTTEKDVEGYRKLQVPIKRPSKVASLFWWLVGIALAVVWLALVLLAYRVHMGK